MVSVDALTPEQEAVVHHGDGPAIVLAVPGAGKTTALVHRIRALVTNQHIAPDDILACSFGRDTVADLRHALEAVGVEGGDVCTFHSLGRRFLPDPATASDASPSTIAHRLARRALRDLADDRGVDPEALDIRPTALVDQVAAWKQQLAYADLDAAALPPDAQATARQATHENEDVLRLYERFEAHRRRSGLRTYPDMLRDAWERLVQDADLRARAQGAHEYVLVDEFQDVSRAQFELLDCLTAGSRNYMVVGDDDQCIYRWRGARPDFLRNFADRYGATTYRMTTSFRLPLGPLTIANAAIAHNEERVPKQMTLVRGVEGHTECLRGSDAADTANQIARTIDHLCTTGTYSLSDIVVLVRTYGQTPPIERALTAHDLPYRIHGRPPFYRRTPVQTLLRYLYWAVLERRRRSDGGPNATSPKTYTRRFSQIVNHPNRYIPRDWIDTVTQEAREQDVSLLKSAETHLSALAPEPQQQAESFLDTAAALVERLDDSPGAVLRDLTAAIGYEEALRERSVRRNRGEARVRTVRALQRHADQYDTVPALLQGIQTLAATDDARTTDAPALDLRSIHRAKGAEWPVVVLPGCVEGTLPHVPDHGPTDLEEERRLFYVASTRAQERLYLTYRDDAERSRFLDDAEVDTRLPLCRAIQRGLTGDPSALSDTDAAKLCYGLATLSLSDFITDHWSPPSEQTAALRQRLNVLAATIEDAHDQRAAYRTERAEYEDRRSSLQATVDERTSALRDHLGNTPLTAQHEADPDTYYPDDAQFTFRWTEDETQVAVEWQGNRVGILDPFDSSRLDADTFLHLPWADLVGHFSGLAQGRTKLRLTIDWTNTREHLLRTRQAELEPPDPPGKLVDLLTDDDFEEGYALLRDRPSEAQPTSS